MAPPRFDLCLLGGGPSAVTLAAAGAQLGLKVALVGDPDAPRGPAAMPALAGQAFLAAAARGAAPAGFGALMEEVARVVAAMAVNEAPARAGGLGVRLYRGAARFLGRDRLAVGAESLTARRFILIPRARPCLPPDPACLTAETLWDLRERPAALTVLGGAGFGCGMALAFARLGSRVRLLAPEGLLPREDPEAVDFLRRSLRRAGVLLAEGDAAGAAEREGRLLAALGWERDYAPLELPAAGIACRDGRPSWARTSGRATAASSSWRAGTRSGAARARGSRPASC